MSRVSPFETIHYACSEPQVILKNETHLSYTGLMVSASRIFCETSSMLKRNIIKRVLKFCLMLCHIWCWPVVVRVAFWSKLILNKTYLLTFHTKRSGFHLAQFQHWKIYEFSIQYQIILDTENHVIVFKGNTALPSLDSKKQVTFEGNPVSGKYSNAEHII